MFKRSKESGDYLSQIRNNVAEKVGIINDALVADSLPRNSEGKLKIVELGTGGGESLRRLKSNVGDREDAELIAVDVLPNLASSLKKELDIEAVAADAGHLSFADESLSAINASAIIHEVSSYGTRGGGSKGNEMIYGKDAVKKAFGEFNRVLLPEGIVAYRDILAPLENLQVMKTVQYRGKSWHAFANCFLDKFLASQPKMYDDAAVTMEMVGDNLTLHAPIGLQREFQRHYLMFRDYLRNVGNELFGITMSRSDWINEVEGLKSITFSIDDHLATVLDLGPFEVHESATGRVYKGNSDQFDKLYDDAMAYRFEKSNEGQDFENLIETWREREGLEHYLCGNIGDMVELSIEASGTTDDAYVLMPEALDDIAIAPRYYYNRYLRQVIDNPEQDGKQMISFKKLSKPRALQSLESFEQSGQEVFGANVIERLRSRL
jgi:ubiquinone/menaquinone biosynthesis C-methylase UbiE